MMPEHMREMDGKRFCAHCGGSVDGDGYSAGGEVEPEDEAMREGDADELPQQYQATTRMRDAAFADAVGRRKR